VIVVIPDAAQRRSGIQLSIRAEEWVPGSVLRTAPE